MSEFSDAMKLANDYSDRAATLARDSRCASSCAGREWALVADRLCDVEWPGTLAACVKNAVEAYMLGQDWIAAESVIDRWMPDSPTALHGYLTRRLAECQEKIQETT